MSLAQSSRFGTVGLLNTFLTLAVIYALKLFAGAGDVAANALGYAVGMTVGFALNRSWTFSHQGSRASASVRYLATVAISYAMNLLVVMVAIRAFGVNGYVAQLLGIAPYTITSFLLCKYWVFRASRPDPLF